MPSAHMPGDTPLTLAQRLAAQAERTVVGRDAEIAHFERLLAPALPPLALLWYHGPGGIGKSTLLHRLRDHAEAGGRATAFVDAQLLEPTPSHFESLLAGVDPRQAGEPGVLFIDTAEHLRPLVGWLRRDFLPALPASWLVVAAGRHAPPADWSTDPAWHGLLQVHELPPLGDDDARRLLAQRGVPPAGQAGMLARARGHPLALALMADADRGSAGDDRVPADDAAPPLTATAWDPALVQTLVQRFTRERSAPQLRRALAVAALSRHTTRALLADALGVDEADAAFDALRQLSFMHIGARGLSPHELVRDVLVADLRWRDPESMRAVVRTLIRHHYQRMVAAEGAERIHHQSEALYTQRHAEHKSRYFAWDELGLHRVATARDADLDAVRAMVQRHEGSAAWAHLERWWHGQRDGFRLFWRGDGDERCDGFLLLLRLRRDDVQHHLQDPAVAAAWQLVQAARPLAAGDELVLLRHWMHAERHQAVTAAINLTSMHVVSHLIGNPASAFSVVWMADPGFWQPHFVGVNFARCPLADYTVAGRRHGAFAHDWRLEPPEDWITGDHRPMPFADAQRVADLAPTGAMAPAVTTTVPWIEQVRQALRDATDVPRLAQGELGQSLGLDGAGVQQRLRQVVQQLAAHPRDAKFRDALWHTYIEPQVKQEQVAAELGVPYPTYRYRLQQGIERLAAALSAERRFISD